MCSHIFIIHNDHTYITGDYTKLYLNIICNRSFFNFEMMSALFRSEFYTRMKRYWGENIYLPHAQTAIYDSKVKLFLKQGISHQLGRDAVVRFECENSAIFTWSLIFYEKYFKSQSAIVLVVLTTANFGGFSNFCRYRHGMCFRASSVFVLSILFWYPQRKHYFWRIFRFLFMEHKQDYSMTIKLTSVKDVKVCF